MPYKDREKKREYQKIYHIRTWAARKEKHYQLKTVRRKNLALWLKSLKKELVCANCGENNPICLDFHHSDSKLKDKEVANMITEGYSQSSILKEIRKCVVLCANCHRKTHGV